MITYSELQKTETQKLLQKEISEYCQQNQKKKIELRNSDFFDSDDKKIVDAEKINVGVFSYEEMKDLNDKWRMSVYEKLYCKLIR